MGFDSKQWRPQHLLSQDDGVHDQGPPPVYETIDSNSGPGHDQNREPASSMPGAFPQYSQHHAPLVNRSVAATGRSMGKNPASAGTLTSRSTAQAPASKGSADDLEQIYIATMGVTGSGKSRFIKLCSESRLVKVGEGMRSCTQEVGEHVFRYRDQQIHLIDTPGFDDTNRSDREVLDDIARWYGTAYRADIQLTGILYLHRIIDPRMGGTALNNLKMFKKLCGENYYPRVCLATTFWDTMDREVAKKREAELINTNEFWGGMVEGGSQIYRHYGNRDSALEILQSIIKHSKTAEKKNVPTFVKVQKEMGEENKTLDQTSAGQEVNAKILEERKKFEEELKEAKEDFKVAIEENDRRAAEAIKKHKATLEAKLQKGHEDQQKLNVRLEDIQARHLQEMEELQKAVEAQRSLIEALQTQNREKDEQLKNVDPDSSMAISLRRDITDNEDKQEEAVTQLEGQQQRLEQKRSITTRIIEWAKRHPDSLKRAAVLGTQLVSYATFARRLKLAERHQQPPTPMHFSYEIEEVDDESEDYGHGHHSPAGFIQNANQNL